MTMMIDNNNNNNNRRIRRLSSAVRDRIAAGEVVQRPCNALKELLENALDAGADTVGVVLHRGGVRLMQVSDNGCGIARDDLPLLCERHATSKIASFDDLRTIATYGFRGEALASISTVALVTVTTKTRTQQLAYTAQYAEGRPRITSDNGGSGSGSSSGSNGGGNRVWRPVAGADGTVVRVENMFYNAAPARRAAVQRREAEEMRRCVDVAKRYALHNHGVSFVVRREADEVVFQTTRTQHQRDTVRVLFSRDIERELLDLELHSDDINNSSSSSSSSSGGGGGGDTCCQFSVKALVSGTGKGWRDKQGNFTLFINNRLVQHRELKRSVLAIYEHYLRRGDHPWVYIALQIDPRYVDVNIHPTKNEVAFHPSDVIIRRLCDAIRERLESSHRSRTFSSMASLPIVSTDTISSIVPQQQQQQQLHGRTTTPNRTSAGSTVAAAESDVHTIANDAPARLQPLSNATGFASAVSPGQRTLQEMATRLAAPSTPSSASSSSTASSMPYSSPSQSFSQQKRPRQLPQHMVRSTDQDQRGQMELYLEDAVLSSPVDKLRKRIAITPSRSKQVKLSSVIGLRRDLDTNSNSMLRDLFRGHTYVGWINADYSLVQHLTKLYLVRNYELSRELAYQMVLERFQGMRKIRLSEPIGVRDMIRFYMDSVTVDDRISSSISNSGGGGGGGGIRVKCEDGHAVDEDEVDRLSHLLTDTPFTEMLDEYFSIEIRDRMLVSLPQVFDNHVPPLHRLPEFLHGLAARVDWSVERRCLSDIARHLAQLYALSRPWELDSDTSSDSGASNDCGGGGGVYTAERAKWVTHRVVFPTAKVHLRPPQEFARDYVVREIACLSQLYKVFERC